MRVSPWRCVSAVSRLQNSRSVVRSTLSALSTYEGQVVRLQTFRSLANSSVRQFSSSRVRKDDLSEVKLSGFSELRDHGLVHENIVKSITQGMGLSTMTDVQSATIRSALEGTDVIAQAKTGTGKTLAFLIPQLQRMIAADPDLARSTYRPQRTTADDIRGIVISPTRELAEQIAEEARKVVKGTAIIVQAAVGGTQKSQMLRQMQFQGCHLLVGTPGRLQDLFSDPSSGVAAPNLKSLVLDEADRLLDDGFWPDIQAFFQVLPPRDKVDRQTLMFSATIPREVVHIVRQTLKPGFQFTRVIGEADVPTTDRVKQNLVILRGYENQLPALLELFQRETDKHKANPDNTRPFKAIVYFRSTAEVTLAASIFRGLAQPGQGQARDAFGSIPPRRSNNALGINMYDIHGKLTQAQRTFAADAFRRATSGILFSSDVTARGMDFPNVTHVIQLGPPPDRESYIHRIGRTARAGKEGEGWIFVHDNEVNEVDRMLSKIPIEEDMSLKSAIQDMTKSGAGPDEKSPVAMIRASAQRAKRMDKANVYSVILLNRGGRGKDKLRGVQAANDLAIHGWGMTEPPGISAATARKHGLREDHGIVIGEEQYEESFSRGGQSRFGGARSGGDRGGRYGGGDRGGSRDAFGDSSSGGRGGRGGYGGSGSRFGKRSFN